jgi:hypothetical protein
MKSIQDWRRDKEIDKEINETLGLNVSSVKNVLGSTSSKVDPTLRATLRTKILQIARDYPEVNPLNLFREIMKVVGMLIWKMSGTSVSASKFSGVANQNAQDQNEWAIIKTIIEQGENDLDSSLMVRSTGNRLETDSKIKSALKVAYDHIRNYSEYKDMPADQLFDKMQDALLLLAGDLKGNVGSTRMAVDKINNDPIAREISN